MVKKKRAIRAPRVNNLETTLLTIELLRRIPRGFYTTAAELKRQISGSGIERDIRTIQRQLTVLADNFDIECDTRDRPYRYRWLPKAEAFILPQMTAQESLLLNMAQEQLKNLLPVSVMATLNCFFEQARYNLVNVGNEAVANQWRQKVKVVSSNQPLLSPDIKEGVFDAVSHALYNNLTLNIDYKNRSGLANQYYDITPLGLVQQDVALYLVCRFKGHEDNRILALHRMQAATATSFACVRPQFSLEEYCESGAFGFGSNQKIELQFDIEKKAGVHLLEMKLSTDQVVEELEHHYRIKATVVDTSRLEWWLRGFGDSVREIKRREIAHP